MRTPPRAARLVTGPILVVLLILGDAARINAGGSGPSPTEQGTMKTIVDQLLAADSLFAAEVSAARGARRTDVWAGWFAADGCQIVPGAVVAGREAIRELMEPAFADTAFSLTWEPDLAEGAGDLGWTSGRYVSTRPGPDGPVIRRGRYLTCWRRTADGSWKVVVDTGSPDGD